MANCVTCDAICERAGQHRVKTDCISYVPKVYPKFRTNYDCIVSKSPEDLVEYIRVWFPEACPPGRCPGEDYCYKCWLDWLKQEAQDD